MLPTLAIAAMPVLNLPGDVVLGYSAALADGNVMVVTRPRDDWSYADFRLFLGSTGTLQLPAEWTSGFELESVKLLVNSKIDTQSPYCRPGEKPDLSTTSTSQCTAWDGKMIYWGHPIGAPQTGPTVAVNHVVGWWSWQ